MRSRRRRYRYRVVRSRIGADRNGTDCRIFYGSFVNRQGYIVAVGGGRQVPVAALNAEVYISGCQRLSRRRSRIAA